MKVELLKCKVHRATVTDSDLNYEGSITMDPVLCKVAGLHRFEKVDILNCNNGCLLYTSPSPRDQRGSRMPSSA